MHEIFQYSLMQAFLTRFTWVLRDANLKKKVNSRYMFGRSFVSSRYSVDRLVAIVGPHPIPQKQLHT